MALDLSTLTTEQQLAAIYIGYYDRAADPVGEDFWEGAVANPNLSLADIATDFATQPETLIAYPFLSDPTAEQANAFISEVYLNLFNRAPDQAGLEFWSEALLAAIDGTGALTVGEIILSIIEGAQDSAEGNDRTTILNKIEVATSWTNAADAAAIDYTTDTAAQNSAKSIIEAVTDSPATVTAAKQTIDNFFEPAPVPGEEFLLTSATDVITGTSDDDEFNAYIQQNPFAGGISNSLSSADRLDGGAGNDRLYAEITGEFIGVTGSVGGDIDVQPRLKNIEEIDIEARDGVDRSSFISNGGEDEFEATVDGKNITDHEEIGSYFSDGDLKIENLTTLTSSGAARNTSEITITMDHTDNVNTDGDASDLIVLFDNDYLLSGQEAEGKIFYFLLDEDAELVNNPNRLNNIDVDGLRFTIDTGNGPVEVTLEAAAANVAGTHQGFVNALQPALQALIADGTLPAGTTLTLDPTITTTTFIDDGSESDPIPAIVLTSGDGSPVIATGFSRIEEEIGEYDVFGRFNSINEIADQPISIDIDVHKVGRGGEGGDLIVGGKAEETPAGIAAGIEVFNLNVLGGSEKPSWINNLNSTGDALDTVIVTTDLAVAGTGDVADLIINEIGGASELGRNEETDVRVFDATAFEGDFTGFARLDEFGNGAHSYLLGGGNDRLSIDFDSFGGAAGDSLVINTGAGDDVLRLNTEGNDTTPGEGTDLEFLDIETGAGDDTVFFNTDNANTGPNVPGDTTTGDGASISTSAGEDNIYMNNGSSSFVELSLVGDGDVREFQLFGASIQVTIDGVLSEWVDIDYDRTTYTTSREDIRDAALAAIAQSTALSDMVEIVELADGTVQIRSLVSGSTEWSFNVEGPVASNALDTDTTFGAEVAPTDGGEDEPVDPSPDTGWPLLNAQPTLNQVNVAELEAAWSAWYPGSAGIEDTTSAGSTGFLGFGPIADVGDILEALDFVADFGDTSGTLTGPTGNASDDNVINAGADDDLIALAANAVSTAITNDENGNGNTIEFTGQFGWDTIVNFTIGAISGSSTVPLGSSDLNDNDIMDFFSYLDGAAAARATSVGPQASRVADDVDFTFTNSMGATLATATAIDHNQIRLMDFSELWNDLNGTTAPNGTPATSTAPANFDSITAANVDTWLEEFMSATANGTLGSLGGATATAVGNNFLILIGKDGDVEIDITGATRSFDPNHADNQFWVFEAEVTSFTATGADNFEYSVSLLGGVDLAQTDITTLTLNEFGIV